MRKILVTLIPMLLGAWTLEVLADPPAHAPAHGWRKKHDPHYVGYTGAQWERDYDIQEGRCNRQAVGAVLGGIAGGVIGSRVGSGDGRVIATVAGAALGALIGARIGRNMDEGDRACIGHALEIGAPGRAVLWQSPAGVSYRLVPGEKAKRDAGCRKFTLTATQGKDKSSRDGVACRSDGGVWKIVGA